MLLARTVVVALVVLGASAVPAAAVQPGPNGKIVFASGRSDGISAPFTDATAQLWIVGKPGGTPTRVTLNAAIQHRHPSWSPDRTKIAYAAGPPADYDIYVLDLTEPASGTNPRDITQNPGISDDRPSWSPDGTRIAYASGPATIGDIYVQNANGPQITPITNTAANMNADKPSWSPDSKTLYYSQDVDPLATVSNDIYRAPADGSQTAGTPVITGATDDYQPAVSPDGQDLCFTRGPFGTTSATVQRSAITGGIVTPIANTGTGDYNCVWSPDRTKIAYVSGTFGNGGTGDEELRRHRRRQPGGQRRAHALRRQPRLGAQPVADLPGRSGVDAVRHGGLRPARLYGPGPRERPDDDHHRRRAGARDPRGGADGRPGAGDLHPDAGLLGQRPVHVPGQRRHLGLERARRRGSRSAPGPTRPRRRSPRSRCRPAAGASGRCCRGSRGRRSAPRSRSASARRRPSR